MIRDIFFDYSQFETGTKRSQALNHGYHDTLGLDARDWSRWNGINRIMSKADIPLYQTKHE